MKSEQFGQISIKLDKPAYYSGDILNGKVDFNLESRVQISSLFIKLIGYSKVKW